MEEKIMEEKICTKCERILSVDSFTQRKGHPARLRSRCEECRNVASRERFMKKRIIEYRRAEKLVREFPDWVIREIISLWLIQWEQRKNLKHISLATMVSTGCIVEGRKIFFSSSYLLGELRYKNINCTTSALRKVLRGIGAKPTKQRRKFDGQRIRTWDISEKYFHKTLDRGT